MSVGRVFPKKRETFGRPLIYPAAANGRRKKRGKLYSPPPLLPLVRRGETEKKGLFIILPPPLFLRRIVCGKRKRGRGGGSQKSNWLPPSLFPLTPCDMTLKRTAKERATYAEASVAAAAQCCSAKHVPRFPTHTPFVIVAMFEFWEGIVGGS